MSLLVLLYYKVDEATGVIYMSWTVLSNCTDTEAIYSVIMSYVETENEEIYMSWVVLPNYLLL